MNKNKKTSQSYLINKQKIKITNHGKQVINAVRKKNENHPQNLLYLKQNFIEIPKSPTHFMIILSFFTNGVN